MIVASCSSLPVSGPTGLQIEHAARESTAAGSPLPFRIVEVADGSEIPPAPTVPRSRLVVPTAPPTDLIGPGDVLNITVYEAGVSLFGHGATRISGSTTPSTALAGGVASGETTEAEHVPGVRVDDEGYIRFPFVGRMHAAGRTTSELQAAIRNRLSGMSQDPQVMVSIGQSISDSVVLAGEVAKPGRFVLSTNHETLNQTIALAGGYRGDPKDLVARVQRNDGLFEIRLSDLLDTPDRDLPIAAGDTITLVSRPQSFSALGAANRTEQIRFPKGRISVAEAVALAGGANPEAGDAAAIFLFRYVSTSGGTEEPIVYHLNLMRAGAYLLAQRFMMRDGDILYIGNARANQLTKSVNVLSQLFVPVVTARTALPAKF